MPPFSPSSFANLPICGPSFPGKASIHCVPEMNSSSAGAGSILASRMTKIGFCLLTARSTSRATKAEPFEPFDSTSTKALALSMPLMISSP